MGNLLGGIGGDEGARAAREIGAVNPDGATDASPPAEADAAPAPIVSARPRSVGLNASMLESRMAADTAAPVGASALIGGSTAHAAPASALLMGSPAKGERLTNEQYEVWVTWNALTSSSGYHDVNKTYGHVDGSPNIPYLAEDLAANKPAAFLAAFDAARADIAERVSKGEVSPERGQALLRDIYERFARPESTGDSFTDRFAGRDASTYKKLLASYLGASATVGGKTVSLSGPYAAMDTDGDGVKDVEELARGTRPTLHDELARSDPKQARARADALDATLHPSAPPPAAGKSGAPARTWIGDSGNPLSPKGGYVDFTPRTIARAGKVRPITVPDKLKVADGTVTSKPTDVKFTGNRPGVSESSAHATGILVQDGGRTLLAVPDKKGELHYYAKGERSYTQQKLDSKDRGLDDPMNTIEAGGATWEPLEWKGDRKLTDLAEVYGAAYKVASGGPSRLAPADEAARGAEVAKATQDLAKSATAKTQVEAAARVSSGLEMAKVDGQNLRLGAHWMQDDLQPLMPLVQSGIVKIGKDDQGRPTLRFGEKPAAMSSSEWTKLQSNWTEKLYQSEGSLQRHVAKLDDAKGVREMDAASLASYVNDSQGQYLAYMKSIPPERRWQEMSRVATALAGTAAGAALGKDLLAAQHGDRSSPLANLLLKERPTTKEGTAALASAIMSLTPQLDENSTLARARGLELILGHDLSSEEFKGLQELESADTTEKIDKVLKTSVEAGKLVDALTETLEHHDIEKGVGAMKTGVAVISSLMVVGDIAKMAKEGLSVETVGETAAHSLDAVGAWAKLAASDAPTMELIGKYAGPVASMVEYGVEIYGAINEKDPEERAVDVTRAAGTMMAGIGMVAVASTPVGWALLAGGVAIRLFVHGKSEAYKEANKKFEEAFGEE